MWRPPTDPDVLPGALIVVATKIRDRLARKSQQRSAGHTRVSLMSITDLFETTHWSQVLVAQGSNQPCAREALAALCKSYWYPIYAYIRRRGHDPHDTEDLTQSFFAELLESSALARSIRPKENSGPFCWPAATTSSAINATITVLSSAAAIA